MNSRCPPGGSRFITCAIVALGTCVPEASVCAAEVARPVVSRIVALPSPDRASLMIELTDSVARAALTSAADTASAAIEIGPLSSVTPQELVSAPDLSVIATVTVRMYQVRTVTFARVVVQLRSACHQRVRLAGRRVYLDLVPVQPAAALSTTASASPAPSSSSSPTSVPSSPTPGRPSTSAPQPAPAASAPSAAPAPSSASTPSSASAPSAAAPPSAASARNTAAEDPGEQAYRTLETDGLRRAKALATQANVKALEALRSEVIRRDTQLGGKREDMMTHLLDEIDRYTDEARALRLKLDAALFRKSPETDRKPR